jgi:hypothetical protein
MFLVKAHPRVTNLYLYNHYFDQGTLTKGGRLSTVDLLKLVCFVKKVRNVCTIKSS